MEFDFTSTRPADGVAYTVRVPSGRVLNAPIDMGQAPSEALVPLTRTAVVTSERFAELRDALHSINYGAGEFRPQVLGAFPPLEPVVTRRLQVRHLTLCASRLLGQELDPNSNLRSMLACLLSYYGVEVHRDLRVVEMCDQLDRFPRWCELVREVLEADNAE